MAGDSLKQSHIPSYDLNKTFTLNNCLKKKNKILTTTLGETMGIKDIFGMS